MGNWEKLVIAGLLTLTLLGGFLRFYQLGEQSLWIDEAFSIQAAQAILENGKPVFTETGAFYRNHFLNSYIIAGAISLSPLDAFNPVQARWLSALLGTLLIPLIYLFFLKITNNKTISFTITCITAFSVLEIAWSRQARGYAAEQIFVFSSFIFLWLYLKKEKIIYGILAAILFLIAVSVHLLALVFLPVILLIILFNSFLKNTLTIKEITILVILSPIVLFALSLNIPANPSPQYYLEYFFLRTPILSILTLIGAVTMLISSKDNLKKIFLISMLLVPILIFMLASPIAHSRYVVLILPIMFYFVVYLIYKIYSAMFKKVDTPWLIPFSVIITSLLVLSPHLNFLPHSHYLLGYDSPQPDFKKAHLEIANNMSENDTIITAYPYVTELYLEQPGLWIPFSLSGKSTEANWVIVDGKERVTGTDIIEDYSELENILSTKSGYIIIDQLIRKRVPEIINYIEEHPNTNLFHHNIQPVGEVWVYRYDN